MSLFFIGIGMAMVIEGLIWAAVPGMARRALQAMNQIPEAQLRFGALFFAGLGVAIIWMVQSGSAGF